MKTPNPSLKRSANVRPPGQRSVGRNNRTALRLEGSIRCNAASPYYTLRAGPPVIFEAIEEHRMRRRYLRFLVGVLVLAVGMFLWAQVAYLASLWLIGVKWVAFMVAAITMLFACPIITGIAMPPHVGPEYR